MAAIFEDTHNHTQPGTGSPAWQRGGLWCHWVSWPAGSIRKHRLAVSWMRRSMGWLSGPVQVPQALSATGKGSTKQFYCITEYRLCIFLDPRPRGAEQAPDSKKMCRSLLLGGLFRSWLVDTRLRDLQLQDWCFVV